MSSGKILFLFDKALWEHIDGVCLIIRHKWLACTLLVASPSPLT